MTGRCHRHLPSKQHETCNSQQCVLPVGTKSSQQSRRPHVYGRHGGDPHQQRGSIEHFTNNQSNDVIGRGGRTQRAVHQRQNSGVHATDTQGIGTSATTNTHPNQQFDRTHTTHQQDPPQGAKGHGYAIPLVTLPRSTGPVLLLLEAGDTELS